MRKLAQVQIGKNFLLRTSPDQEIQGATGYSNLGELITAILPNIYVVAGIVILLLLIFGGFSFIVNAGKSDPESAAKAKQTLTAALIGFCALECALQYVSLKDLASARDSFWPPAFCGFVFAFPRPISTFEQIR